MDSQLQDKIYLTLLRIWKQSYQSAKLLPIPKNEYFFKDVQLLVSHLLTQKKLNKISPISSIFQKTLSLMLKRQLKKRALKSTTYVRITLTLILKINLTLSYLSIPIWEFYCLKKGRAYLIISIGL